jgi:oxalate decarboxylase/phosphoglucose isomerase-like protein (cupin superfamily)
MKRILIKDLVPGLVSGVEVQMPGAGPLYQENYFEWTPSSLVAKLQTHEVSGGVLRAWHHTAIFREVETHSDAEMFFFVSGVSLMLFMDIHQGQPVPETAQVVRILPGTQIVITENKAHFVPLAEGDIPVEIIVVAPKMAAPRMTLPVEIEGIR